MTACVINIYTQSPLSLLSSQKVVYRFITLKKGIHLEDLAWGVPKEYHLKKNRQPFPSEAVPISFVISHFQKELPKINKTFKENIAKVKDGNDSLPPQKRKQTQLEKKTWKHILIPSETLREYIVFTEQ